MTLSVLLFTVNNGCVVVPGVHRLVVEVIQYGPNSDGMTITVGNGSEHQLSTTTLAKIKLKSNSCDLTECAFL